MSATPRSVRVATVAELRDVIVRKVPLEWATKMLQPVPELPTVPNRGAYLVEKAKGRAVVELGCTGPIAAAIREAARSYVGIDKDAGAEYLVDFDVKPEAIPILADAEIVIASELLEHLMNPGRFLTVLRDKFPTQDTYFTVPHAGAYQVRDGCEVVNKDHVAWYSYTTLSTLLTKCGYAIIESRWYHGQPHKAEGLIMLVRAA